VIKELAGRASTHLSRGLVVAISRSAALQMSMQLLLPARPGGQAPETLLALVEDRSGGQ
jgi:hypothetical protein